MQERTVTIYGINHSGIKYKKKASMYEIVRLYVNIKNHKWVRNFQYIIDEDRVIFLIIEKIPILNWFNGHDYYCYDIYGHKIDAKFIRTCTTVSGVKNSIDEDLVKLVILMHDELESVFRLCLLYTSPSPRDRTRSRMPSSA